jgi:translation initiation factor IF-3
MYLSEAKDKAREENLDLMEIWRNWDISIVKILDYWKYLYRQKKQEQKQKQKWKAPDLKTLRITFKIWDHDLEIRKKQAIKFWKAHHPLRITLMLKWRENQYWDLAMEKIKSFVSSLDEIYRLEWEIKRNRNLFSAMLKIKQ